MLPDILTSLANRAGCTLNYRGQAGMLCTPSGRKFRPVIHQQSDLYEEWEALP